MPLAGYAQALCAKEKTVMIMAKKPYDQSKIMLIAMPNEQANQIRITFMLLLQISGLAID